MKTIRIKKIQARASFAYIYIYQIYFLVVCAFLRLDTFLVAFT